MSRVFLLPRRNQSKRRAPIITIITNAHQIRAAQKGGRRSELYLVVSNLPHYSLICMTISFESHNSEQGMPGKVNIFYQMNYTIIVRELRGTTVFRLIQIPCLLAWAVLICSRMSIAWGNWWNPVDLREKTRSKANNNKSERYYAWKIQHKRCVRKYHYWQ